MTFTEWLTGSLPTQPSAPWGGATHSNTDCLCGDSDNFGCLHEKQKRKITNDCALCFGRDFAVF